MITAQQFQLIYPSIASFNSDNSYVRVSKKGKKHLVKKNNTKKNLLLAGGIATALAVGGVALYKRESRSLKQLKGSLEAEKRLDDILKSQEDVIRKVKSNSAQVYEHTKDLAKQNDEKRKQFSTELRDIVDGALKNKPTPAQKKDIDDFLYRGKELIF